jgi:uncharacterized protein YndB with AHSA1/START domain
MAERSVRHETIVLVRDFQAARERVFRAWADSTARSRWAIPKPEWQSAEQTQDFRVGGHEVSRFGPRGDAYLKAETYYLDIVPGQRIIMAGTMFARDVPISCSMATVELHDRGKATHMIYTEQAAFLDERDEPGARRKGWQINLDKLHEWLAEGTNSARDGAPDAQ